jgi:hypothetical protein
VAAEMLALAMLMSSLERQDSCASAAPIASPVATSLPPNSPVSRNKESLSSIARLCKPLS